MTLHLDRFKSPIGEIIIVGDGAGLVALDFSDCRERLEAYLATQFRGRAVAEKPGFGGHRERIAAYFAGDLGALDAVPAQPRGSDFQKRAWRALREIGPGRTASYGEIAARLGSPGAARAVGLANSRNPVALVVPCHRVVGSSGALTGYAGGLERKLWLLRHEGARPSATPR